MEFKYTIELSDKLLELEERVSKKLATGWICVGGICVTESAVFGDKTYYQSMMLKPFFQGQ